MILLVVVVGITSFSFIFILYTFTKRKFVKFVPILRSNSVFGHTKLFLHDGDSHLQHLANANELGPIVQYNLFGNHRFCVYDKKLVKLILKGVSEKVATVKANGRNAVRITLKIQQTKLFNSYLQQPSEWI